MTSSGGANNFLRSIRSTPVISGAAAPYQNQQLAFQQPLEFWNFREPSVSSREGTPSSSSSLRGTPALEELPDRVVPVKRATSTEKNSGGQQSVDAIREAAYVGSFPVDESTQEARAEYIKKHLSEKLNVRIAKPVLLAISLSGIKVCCGSGETVFMAHALKRISYATCQPEKCQFSFLAREPKAPTNIQYCHTFLTRRPFEAEELNNIVANAFKMAYLQQQQVQQPLNATTSFNNLILSQIDRRSQEFKLADDRKHEQLKNQFNRISTPKTDLVARERRERRLSSGGGKKKNGLKEDFLEFDDGHSEEAILSWARNAVERLISSSTASSSSLSSKYDNTSCNNNNNNNNRNLPVSFTSSSSDRISLLTEVSNLCGTTDELSAIDDFLFGLTNQPGSPVSAIKDFVERNFVSLFGGEVAYQGSNIMTLARPLFLQMTPHCRLAMPEDLSPLELEDQQLLEPSASFSARQTSGRRKFTSGEDADGDDEEERPGDDGFDDDLEMRMASTIGGGEKGGLSRERSLVTIGNNVENLSREYFSKNGRADELNDSNLNEAAWYQPGVPRDVALNKLLHQVNGTFVVRDSSTHMGCYALSIKVPKYDSPNEITHYLIVRTPRGTFKIKGLTKEWSSLTSLVLHHTIMRELLPCLLVLPSKQ